MDLLKYQDWTHTTAVYPESSELSERELNYLALGLAGEAGEVAGKVKKAYRSGFIKLDAHTKVLLPADVREAILDEMGDTLWYLARLCKVLNVTIPQIAEFNHRKLEARKAQGQLGSFTR